MKETTGAQSPLSSYLNETLLGVVFSFCNVSDLIQLLDTNHDAITKAAKLTLSNASAIHCSFLLELDRCRNHGSHARKDQETCIRQLLDAIHDDNNSNNKLERIELSGLRHVVGNQGTWLSRLFSATTTLTSIDFSGCGMLDPRLVHSALVSNTTTTATTMPSALRHLQFQGCYRIDAPIVLAIATSPRFVQLESLGLGGCSQSIGNECVQAIVTNLRHLRYLDLSGLKRITEQASMLFQFLPETMESLELAGCELLRFTDLSVWARHVVDILEGVRGNPRPLIHSNMWLEHPQLLESLPVKARHPWRSLTRINFNGIGTPRRGLVAGALPYFALRSMGCLREVHLSGCEHIGDWEVQLLAMTCAQSLTCIEMRACCIGDEAIRALGVHCTQLSDIDFSACFKVSDVGVASFCRHQGALEKLCSNSPTGTQSQATKKRAVQSSSTIRSLKMAALPQLTNDSVRAVAALDSLLLLDVSNCPKLTSDVLAETVTELTSLIDVDAKGIGKWSSSVAVLYCYDDEHPKHLRFVNGRRFQNKATASSSHNAETNCSDRCIVRQHCKRFEGSGVPLQPMYHCLDCRLIPSLNRGMCHSCAVHCHKDHQTYVGSYTRFYCDCPFGIAGKDSPCQTMNAKSANRIEQEV